MNEFSENQARLNALKQLLNNTDYKAIKASEGEPGSDWEEIKVKRQEWREEINSLEEETEQSPVD